MHLNARIAGIRGSESGPVIHLINGAQRSFDAVVVATHVDETLRLLIEPSVDEQGLLGAWHYEKNDTVLHTCPSVMPPNERAWASWNL